MSLCPCLIAVLQRLFPAVIVVTERLHESLYKNSEKKINRYIRNEFCSVAFIVEVSVFADEARLSVWEKITPDIGAPDLN